MNMISQAEQVIPFTLYLRFIRPPPPRGYGYSISQNKILCKEMYKKTITKVIVNKIL